MRATPWSTRRITSSKSKTPAAKCSRTTFTFSALNSQPQFSMPTSNIINKINDGGRSYGSDDIKLKRYDGSGTPPTYIDPTPAGTGTYITDDFNKTQATNSQ